MSKEDLVIIVFECVMKSQLIIFLFQREWVFLHEWTFKIADVESIPAPFRSVYLVILKRIDSWLQSLIEKTTALQMI